MAGTIEPIPLDGGGIAPEVLPWAVTGTTLEPATGQEDTGWQPYGVGPPPDYRIENYFRQNLWKWLQRLQEAALLSEYCDAQYAIAGFADPPVVGNTYIVTVNGNPNISTVTTELTKAALAATIAANINSDPALNQYVSAASSGPDVLLVSRTAGADGVFTAATGGVHVGTFLLTGPSVPVLRTDTGDAALDLVIGSPDLDAAGGAPHQARLIWRKALGAFRAGRDTVGAWDLANCGTDSCNLGRNNQSLGDQSFAAGDGNSSGGQASFAGGLSSSAGGAAAVALGNSCSAGFASSVAMGAGAQANDVQAVAIGAAVADAQDSVALGQSAAGGVSSFAAAGENLNAATASADHSLAMLGGSLASVTKAKAIGYGAQALAESALSAGTETIASGVGSLASGIGRVAAVGQVIASGDGAAAHGIPGPGSDEDVLAAGVESYAFGKGTRADTLASRATGVGSHANNNGEVVHAAGQFGALALDTGSTQWGVVHVHATTTDAAATQLTPTPGTTTNAWTPLDNGVYAARVQALAYRSAGGLAESWEFWFSFKKIAGAITFAPALTAQQVVNGASAGTNPAANLPKTWGSAVQLQYNAAGADITLTATGVAAETWRWAASIHYTRVGET